MHQINDSEQTNQNDAINALTLRRNDDLPPEPLSR